MKIYTPKQLEKVKSEERRRFFTITLGSYNPCGEIILPEQQHFANLYHQAFPQLGLGIDTFPIITSFVSQSP